MLASACPSVGGCADDPDLRAARLLPVRGHGLQNGGTVRSLLMTTSRNVTASVPDAAPQAFEAYAPQLSAAR